MLSCEQIWVHRARTRITGEADSFKEVKKSGVIPEARRAAGSTHVLREQTLTNS